MPVACLEAAFCSGSGFAVPHYRLRLDCEEDDTPLRRPGFSLSAQRGGGFGEIGGESAHRILKFAAEDVFTGVPRRGRGARED